MILAGLLLGLVIALVVMVLLTAAYHVWRRVPYVPTPMVAVRAMVELAALTGGERVYDLGAGDCRLLIEAKRACPGIRAVGYEGAPLIWLLGKLRILLSGVGVELSARNFLVQDLSDAAVIFLYVTPGVMRTLSDKFTRELVPGTRVISHVFTFSGRTPHVVREVDVPLWGRKKVYLYRW